MKKKKKNKKKRRGETRPKGRARKVGARKTKKTMKKMRKIKTAKAKKMRKKAVSKGRAVRRKAIKKPIAQKPTYTLNTDFEFFYELRDLILKSSPAEKGRMVEKLNKVGRIKLAIVSGVFINKENLDPLITDLFIVGDDIDRRKLRAFLRAIEAEVGREIRFTVMDKDEFQYRLAMFDRFIRVLLEGPHEKLINRLGL